MADVMRDAAVTAGGDETRAFAEAVWDRWEHGTLAWLQDLGHWTKTAGDQRVTDAPDAKGRCVFIEPTGALAVAERDGTLPVASVRFEACLDDGESLEEAAELAALALDCSIDGLSIAVARMAGKPGGEDRATLIAATGPLSAQVDIDERGRWVRGELPVALAMPLPERELPPADVAEPELEVAASTAPPPPPLAEPGPTPAPPAAATPTVAEPEATVPAVSKTAKKRGGGNAPGSGDEPAATATEPAATSGKDATSGGEPDASDAAD